MQQNINFAGREQIRPVFDSCFEKCFLFAIVQSNDRAGLSGRNKDLRYSFLANGTVIS